MTLAQHQYVIQTFTPYRALEALNHIVGIGSTHWRFEHPNTSACSHAGEVCTIFSVVVANNVFRSLTERRGLAELLGGPGVRRMRGHSEVNNAPRGQLDDEEHEILAKGQGDHR